MTTTHVVLRVRGHLDDHWADRLGGLTVARDADGTTTLTGPLIDQTELHSILTGLRDLGVVLLGLRVDESDASTAPAP